MEMKTKRKNKTIIIIIIIIIKTIGREGARRKCYVDPPLLIYFSPFTAASQRTQQIEN